MTIRTQLLQIGSQVKILTMPGGLIGTVTRNQTPTSAILHVNIPYTLPGRLPNKRSMDLLDGEYEVINGGIWKTYTPPPEPDLTWTLPEPLADGTLPAKPDGVETERYDSPWMSPWAYLSYLYNVQKRYELKRWHDAAPEYKEAVEKARTEYQIAMWDLFKQDMKTVYGLTGELEAYFDAVFKRANDEAESEYMLSDYNVDVWDETLDNFENLHELLAGYKLVKDDNNGKTTEGIDSTP